MVVRENFTFSKFIETVKSRLKKLAVLGCRKTLWATADSVHQEGTLENKDTFKKPNSTKIVPKEKGSFKHLGIQTLLNCIQKA